jgi:NAD(P)-dependent dehydrogenase (short-subunit alcohol dehydrogenase family)
MELQGKSYLIVGGSSGIGRATAKLAIERGASVEIVGRSADKLGAAAATIESNKLSAVSLDMMDEKAVRDYFSGKAEGAFDALIITASSAVHGPFATAKTKDIEGMIASKFMGPFVFTREALPYLRDGGSITFTSGVLSRRPGANGAGLSAVNAAVEGLSRAMALELGPRLRVNTLSPGMTRTDAYSAMTDDAREAMFQSVSEGLPLKRVADANDLAEAALFLSSNSFTTGHVMDVDGGHMVAS